MNKKLQALGRMKPGQMNQMERMYCLRLERMKYVGEICWFSFEGMKFRLADKTSYTPDFMVMLADGSLQAHEVKGLWMDDARVKIKVAAQSFPIQFVGVTQKKGLWSFEEF